MIVNLVMKNLTHSHFLISVNRQAPLFEFQVFLLRIIFVQGYYLRPRIQRRLKNPIDSQYQIHRLSRYFL